MRPYARFAAACLLGALGLMPQRSGRRRRTHHPDQSGRDAGRERTRRRVRARERAQGDRHPGGGRRAGAENQRRPGRPRHRKSGTIEELVKNGKVVAEHGHAVRARRSRPFGARWRAEARHQHGGSLQGDVARGEVDRLFARLQRHEYRGGDCAARAHRAVEGQDDFHQRRSRHRLSGARRFRDRHSADQHHGRRARNGLCRAAAGRL